MEKELEFIIPNGYAVDKEKSTDNKIVYKMVEIDKDTEVKKILFDTFDGLSYDLKKSKGYIFYKKDGYYYLCYEKKNDILYYDYYRIYSVLNSRFGFNEQTINKLVKDMVCEALNLKVSTTHIALSRLRVGV